jgi:Mg2+/Co2+ transporter CorB
MSISLSFLISLLILLIVLSAFFSSVETAMMAVNRYKLQHLANTHQHAGAKRVLKLLSRTDLMLTIVLIGNTIANIFASTIVTLIGAHFAGAKGAFAATLLLTFIILIFAEIGPKSITARYPQRYAIFAAWPLQLFLWLFYPLVWFSNTLVRLLLLPFGINISQGHHEPLNPEELKSIVNEATSNLTHNEQDMLVRILDLEKITVEDLMVPRNEINGIDLADDWNTILEQLYHTQHTRLPLYMKDLNELHGVLHVREVLHLLSEKNITRDSLLQIAEPPYFIPETASLNKQLLNFQKHQARLAFIVDEYGDIRGLLALEDILEEVVGKFTTDLNATTDYDIQTQSDGSIILDGSITLRELNRHFNWQLQSANKTLSGLIIEYFEGIPEAGICLSIDGHHLEILRVQDNLVKTVKLI